MFSQTRDEVIGEIKDLQTKIIELEKVLLEPGIEDFERASSEGLDVFRLLPYEKYGFKISSIRGGGAYYSFTNKSHSYDETPQISLEKNNLKVGFAGADFQFLSVSKRPGNSEYTGRSNH
jgi:hypothetical protein